MRSIFAKFGALLLCVCLMLGAVGQITVVNAAHGNPGYEIVPFYENINSARVTLTIYNGVAYMSASLSGTENTKSITAFCYLEYNNNGTWEHVDSWYDTTQSKNLFIDNSYPLTDRGEYRFRISTYFRGYETEDEQYKGESHDTY